MGGFKCFGKDLRETKLLLGLISVVAILLMAILGPFFAPYDPNDRSLVERRQLPNRENIFGRNAYGRDILIRVIYGARVTVITGFTVVIISILIGTFLGVICGYWRGIIDNVIIRDIDLLLAFSYCFLAILIVAILGQSLFNEIIAVAISSIPQFTRVVRGLTLSIKQLQYIEAAKAMGHLF